LEIGIQAGMKLKNVQNNFGTMEHWNTAVMIETVIPSPPEADSFRKTGTGSVTVTDRVVPVPVFSGFPMTKKQVVLCSF
jgi:hypothetical protein